MMSIYAGRMPVILIAVMAMMLFAGAALGASQAEAGKERVDLSERIDEELFTEDGELKEDAGESPPEASAVDPLGKVARNLSPETPRLDAAMRQYLVAPLLRGASWVAEAGFNLGYSMTATLGADITRVILNGGVVATVAGVAWSVYRRSVRAAREVGA